MIKSGSTAWQIIRPGVDLGLIDSIIITYKTLPGYGSRVLLQRQYPDDTRVNGDELLLPLSQADTTLLREEGGDRVRLELQYNYSSGAVAKSEIQTVHIGDTLATAFVDGSNPDEAQIEGLPIKFTAGDAIVIESKNKCVKDWNENDPESEKYIEGRTHYKKPTYPSDAPMIETPTAGATLLYDFTGLSATYINRILYENATDPDGQYPFEWNWEAKLSTGWMASENTSAGNYYAEKIDDANFRIMGNKKYDFYLYFVSDPALLSAEYAGRFPSKGIYVTVNDAGTANIRNFKGGFKYVVKLSRNYIPDSIARKADVVARQQSVDDVGKALVIGEDGVVKAGEVGGTVVVTTTEPAEDDIPKVFIAGVKPTTKDDVLAEMRYISKTEDFHAYLEIKCQGSSSMSYPKKNFTVKLYSDEARETEQKKSFKGWNHESNKFVLKANWIDHSHARNIVSARVWDEIVKSRPDYDTLPEEMRNSPQNGAIDGFPVKLYYNGTYEGLYTWNIGKDDWMWGMDEDNPNHVLLSCCYNDNGVLLEKAGNFRALWSGINEDNWKVEVGTNSDAVKTSLNNLISCVKDTDDETFKATIGNHLDINSAIDYYLYFWANAGLDNLENNMLLATYDGVKWICGAYDMDSVWGLHYTGKSFIAVNFVCPDQYQAPYSLLWERVVKLFVPELKARYAELRNDALSIPNLYTHFERYMDVIGLDLYAEDLTVYSTIPSGSTNNIKQIRNYIRDRLAYVDAEIANLVERIPCTGVTLSADTLSFTAAGTQTITATATPENTTDKIVWTSTDSTVASVSAGVVTAKANGNATITATCGGYSASCEVSVSGIESVESVVTEDLALWFKGADFTNDGSPTVIPCAEESGIDELIANGFAYTTESGSDGAGNVSTTGSECLHKGVNLDAISLASGFTFMAQFSLKNAEQAKKYFMCLNPPDATQMAIIYGYVNNTFELYSDGPNYSAIRTGSQIVVEDTDMHTIAYTYDGAKLLGYLDGAKVVDVIPAISMFSTPKSVRLLNSDAGKTEGILAKLRHFMIYNRALTASEIVRNINAVGGSVEDDEDDVTDGEGVTVELTSGSAINTSGNVVAYSGTYLSDFLEVEVGKLYRFYIPSGSTAMDVWGYDESQNPLKALAVANISNSIATFDLAIPSPVAYVRICVYNTRSVTKAYFKEIIVDESVSDNLRLTKFYRIDSNGDLVVATNIMNSYVFGLTTYYPIDEGATYKVDVPLANSVGVFLYDENFNNLGEVGTQSGTANTFTAANGARYARWACIGGSGHTLFSTISKN